MKEHRPDPESLLKRIQQEEKQETRGKLKIYLGAAPGVGKTYTMLQDANAQREKGLDVIIGAIETHGRSEIETLVKKLDILPQQSVVYHGKTLEEFDLDGALKRRPALILMDEMAHTNAPGLRHNKRWQDIKELLDRGIDVYTTLNIQHVESLNDIVGQIIHARIKETVPDSMLELADTVELVDLPPEELIKRLHDGKVYFPEQVELAAENFFRKGNLIALRELALRTTAERVGAQVLLYRQGQGIQHIWPTKEKLLVCVGSRPGSTKIIRAARRMAASLQAEWIAVHVDTLRFRLSEEERHQAIENLRFAEKLGAETMMLSGMNIVTEIMKFAREQNVNKIVIGKHIRPRWKSFFSPSLTDELVRHSGEIDIYSITGDSDEYKPIKRQPLQKRPIAWKMYGLAAIIVGIATALDWYLSPYFDTSNLIMVYLLGVISVSLLGKTGPSIFASILSVLAYDFFFIPPIYSFAIQDLQYSFTLLVMLLVTQIISYLTLLSRREAEAASLAAQHSSALHTLSRQLANTRGVDKLLETGVRYLAEMFNSEVLALFPDNNRLTIRAHYGTKEDIELNEKELSVAQWVFDLGQTAGLGTDTLPFSDALYLPLFASKGSAGVLRIKPSSPENILTPENRHLVEACASQLGSAIEVDRLQEQVRHSEFQVESDRISHTLLQSVSHDLRIPIVAVLGAATTLIEMNRELGANKIKQLGTEIYAEGKQIHRLINNLLQITLLETNAIKLQIKPNSLMKIINQTVIAFRESIEKNPILLNIPDNLPLIPFDNTLLQEVFLNLIDNATKFASAGSPIEISTQIKSNMVQINVEDRGPGIMADEVNKLFEKYYRGRLLTTERGLGLGLAICHNIIKVHGGDIWAENREGGGASFKFTLPL